METKTRKTTMIGAALAVAIIALAGVGYAVTYHATTTNTGNYMDSTYVTMTQTSGATESAAYSGNFLTGLYFDSDNTAASTTVYTPVYTGQYDASEFTYTPSSNTTEDNVALISKDLSLVIVPSAAQANQTGKLTVTVTNSNAPTVAPSLNSGMKFIMLLTDKSTGATYKQGAEYTDNCWTFTGVPIGSATQTFGVQLFVQLSGANVSDTATGLATKTNATAETGAFTSTFKFVLEVIA